MPPARNGSTRNGSPTAVQETRGIRITPTDAPMPEVKPGELGLPIELNPWTIAGFTDPQILRFDQGVTLDDLHRMTQRDGHARSMMNLMSWPMRAAKRTVEPDQDGDEEAEFIRDMFELPPHRGGMSTPMSYVMACIALAFRDAFSVLEKVVDVRADGTQVLRKLSPRPARTISFQYDDHGGLAGVVQRIKRRRKDGGTEEAKVFIPPEKLFVFTVNKEESPLEGESLFLPAYYHFDKKHRLYYIAHLAAQIGAVPVRVGKVAGGSSELRREFAKQLRELGLSGAMAIPPGYEVETHQNGSILGDILALIEHHDVQMSKSILAHFVDMGTEGKGMLGTATTTSELGDLFVVALEAHLQDIAQGFSSYVIPYFIDKNFGSERYPSFAFEPFTDEQKTAMAETFTTLFNAASPPTPEMLFEVQRSHAEALGLEGIDWDALKKEFIRAEEEKRALESAQRKQAQGAAEVPVGPDGAPLGSPTVPAKPPGGSGPPGAGNGSRGRTRAKAPTNLEEGGDPDDVELATGGVSIKNPFLEREHKRDRHGKWVDMFGGAGSKPSPRWESAEEAEATAAAKQRGETMARPNIDPVLRDRSFAKVLPDLSIENDSQRAFRDPDDPSAYLPERDDLHAGFVADLLARAVPPPSDRKPRMFFTMGGPASGKTWLRSLFEPNRDTGKVPNNGSPGPVPIDADYFKKLFPEWKALEGDRREDLRAGILHEESSDLAARTRAAAQDLGFDVLVDQTGNSGSAKAVRKIQEAEAAGYDVQIAMVDIPIDEAIRRADERARTPGPSQGRFVNHAVIHNTHINVAGNLIPILEETNADVRVYNGEVPKGSDPVLIAYRQPGRELVVVPGYEDKWQAVLDKGGLRDAEGNITAPAPVGPVELFPEAAEVPPTETDPNAPQPGDTPSEEDPLESEHGDKVWLEGNEIVFEGEGLDQMTRPVPEGEDPLAVAQALLDDLNAVPPEPGDAENMEADLFGSINSPRMMRLRTMDLERRGLPGDTSSGLAPEREPTDRELKWIKTVSDETLEDLIRADRGDRALAQAEKDRRAAGGKIEPKPKSKLTPEQQREKAEARRVDRIANLEHEAQEIEDQIDREGGNPGLERLLREIEAEVAQLRAAGPTPLPRTKAARANHVARRIDEAAQNTASPLPSGVDPRSFTSDQSAFVLDLLFDDFEAFSDFYGRLSADQRGYLRSASTLTPRVKDRIDVLDKPPPTGVPGYIVPPLADLEAMSKTELRKVIDASGKFPRGHANWLTPREIRAALHEQYPFEARGYGSTPGPVSSRADLDALVADRAKRKGKPAGVTPPPTPDPEPTPPPPTPPVGPVAAHLLDETDLGKRVSFTTPNGEEVSGVLREVVTGTDDSNQVYIQLEVGAFKYRVPLDTQVTVKSSDSDPTPPPPPPAPDPEPPKVIDDPPPPPDPASVALADRIKDRAAKVRDQATDPTERMNLAIEIGKEIDAEVQKRIDAEVAKLDAGIDKEGIASKVADLEAQLPGLLEAASATGEAQRAAALTVRKALGDPNPYSFLATEHIAAAKEKFPDLYQAFTDARHKSYGAQNRLADTRYKIKQLQKGTEVATRDVTKLRAAAERDVLHSVRDFGVPSDLAAGFVPKSSELPGVQRKYAEKALASYPADWYTPAGYVVYNQLPRDYRAFYRRGERSVNLAVNGRPQTAVHELGHHMEYSVPRLKGMARTLLNERTKGQSSKWLGAPYDQDEVYKKDKWPDKYMGKVYNDHATEILTMLMEGVFQERGRKNLDKDPELRAWLYGVLSAV